MQCVNEIKKEISSWLDKEVDIIDHPHSSYRIIKSGKARITKIYDKFFEVLIETKEYGSYKTTISYIDIYTNSCAIHLHQEETI